MAIRHSQKQTSTLRQCLQETKLMGGLNACAIEFVPQKGAALEDDGYDPCDMKIGKRGFVIDMASLVFTLASDDVVMHLHPEKCVAFRTPARPIRRRNLREPPQAEHVPKPPAFPMDCLVNVSLAPERRSMVEAQSAESLLCISTPSIDDCLVSPMSLEVGKGFQLKSSLRVYKVPVANKALRGTDIKAIGESHALQDKPLMIDGFVRVLEESVHGSRCQETLVQNRREQFLG